MTGVLCILGLEFNARHVVSVVGPTQAGPDGRELEPQGEAGQGREELP